MDKDEYNFFLPFPEGWVLVFTTEKLGDDKYKTKARFEPTGEPNGLQQQPILNSDIRLPIPT
jgi:hypothetical protein